MTEEIQQQGIGHRLKEARRQKELSLDSVAEQLNLGVRSIEALEADDFDNMSPPMFTRGYLRAYAKLLDVNADELIDEYNKLAPPDPELTSAYQTVKETESSHPVIRWATVAIVFVIGTLLVFWWYGPRYQEIYEADASGDQTVVAEAEQVQPITESSTTFTVTDVQPVTQVTDSNSGIESPTDIVLVTDVQSDTIVQIEELAVEEEQAQPEQEVESVAANPTFVDSNVVQVEQRSNQSGSDVQIAQVTASSQSLVEQSTSAIDALAAIGSAIAATQPLDVMVESSGSQLPPDEPATSGLTGSQSTTATTLSSAQQNDEIEITGDDVMEIQTSAESWVEVIDANGARLMYGMLNNSRVRNLRGTAPFQVFLGNTPGVSITMNGATVAQPHFNAITNTSRFSLHADGSMQR